MKLRRTLDRVLGWTLVVLMAAMVLDVLWQVASRYVVQEPSSFTDELARYLFIWIGLLGTAYATGQHKHLSLDLLSPRLAAPARRILALVIDLLVIFFAVVVLIVGGARLVFVTLYLEQNSAALQVPLGYVYFALPLAGAIIVCYKVLDIWGATTHGSAPLAHDQTTA
ncbi:MAG: TRAP transporter small permease [Bacteroidia bacterium]